MISFNEFGYESVTGEPNTWEPRVGSPLPYVPPNVVPKAQWELLSRRGVDAAFLLHEVNEKAESDRYWDGLEEVQIDLREEETRARLLELFSHKPFPINEHLRAKRRRAARRENNLRHKYRCE